MSLTRAILLGMFGGLLTGLALNLLPSPVWLHAFLVDGIFYIGGRIFLASLKLLVVPLVFVSLVCGTSALDDVSQLGRLGFRTLGLYLLTTAIALTAALAVGMIIQPGAGFALSSEATFVAKEAPSLADTIIAMFPTNPFRAMAEGNMLQIIVFAILFGVALTMVGDRARRIANAFEELNAVIMQMVLMMMRFAPIGVFCLLATVFAAEGLDAFAPLARYFLCVLFVLGLHALISYPSLLRLMSGLSPRVFLRKIRPVLAVAFSTASSNATLPLTLETVRDRLGVSNAVASFTVPLGATINMDGTAIMQGVATCFIAQAYGIDLSLADLATVVVTATLASVGAAGVPGVGLVTLAMVLEQVGLPVEGIGLILGVDRLLDMVRTSVNVTGDMAVTAIVAHGEGALALETFHGD